jgi:FlaA1/EpsC-like NDP-sugar epimerase
MSVSVPLSSRMRTTLAVAHDLLASAIAWLLAFWLRFNLAPPEGFIAAALHWLPWVLGLQGLIFWRLGLYQGLWRYASLSDLRRILLAAGLAALALPLLLVMLQAEDVPRSVLLLNPLLLTAMMAGNRLLYRMWREHRDYRLQELDAKPVLVLGAGDAGITLTRELARSQEWKVVGFLDDDTAKQGRQVLGLPVLGGAAEVGAVAQARGVRQIIIAMPSAPHARRRAIAAACGAAGLQVFTVPAFDDLVSGRVALSAVRRVEVEDLLGRDPVRIDAVGLARDIRGRVIMVTGAGGSIGAELCRQIARYQPSRLVLFEQGEHALYQLAEEFARAWPAQPVVCVLGDVKDSARLAAVLREQSPALVFHAAAYKHVPLTEVANGAEAVRNNAVGTYTAGLACRAAGVEKFVLISTDKAVNPVNIMGASKRLAELLCQELDTPGGTRFICVRFGNVLGSSGSVVPKFRQQLEAGGPLTVTHPEITRYFMTIPEAAQLVLQAAHMGQGGEVFVLDMGEPVKILDLARLMIRLAGLSEDDIRVEITGLRPGEKLYEEPLADAESTLPTPHEKLRAAQVAQPAAGLGAAVTRALQGASLDDAAVRQLLQVWIPEYQPALDTLQ